MREGQVLSQGIMSDFLVVLSPSDPQCGTRNHIYLANFLHINYRLSRRQLLHSSIKTRLDIKLSTESFRNSL